MEGFVRIPILVYAHRRRGKPHFGPDEESKLFTSTELLEVAHEIILTTY